MARFLVLRPGYVPPQRDSARNQFAQLSPEHCGDILAGSWEETSSDQLITVGNFRYHLNFSYHKSHPIRFLYDVISMVLTGLALHRSQKSFDIIISYGSSKTGLVAGILKLVTKKPLILELPGNPEAAYRFDRLLTPSFLFLKQYCHRLLFRFAVSCSDHLKLLYPTQTSNFSFAMNKSKSIFHDFTAISSLKPIQEDDKYILFLGSPWYLKGVDVLIKAFQLISKDFPDYRLKIVGYTPDLDQFEILRAGDSSIEFSKGVKYDLALELISRCTFFVLPSRTETMGKVLMEARALKKAIIASRVDGIPHYVEDGKDGLLFESENSKDLAAKMRLLLSDRNARDALAERGYQKVHEKYSENIYREEFDKMIEFVLREKKERLARSDKV